MPETTPHPAAPSTGMKRRRAARACLSCRSRKVRCDVSRSGPPCMNCSLDSIACVVKGRKPKSSARGRRTSEASVASPDQCDEVAAEASPSQAAEDLMQLEDAALNHETLAGLDQLAAYNQHDEPPAEQTVDLMYGGVDRPEFQMDTGGLMDTAIHEPPQPTTDTSMLFPDNWLSACVQGSEADCLEIPDRFRPNTTRANSVMYTYYPFLTLDNLYDVLPRDVEFLEAEGCFHLPTRRIMDRILQQYFLHVHPLLPLLNEGDFWEMYYNKGTGSGGGPKMSLLVFQAIMFVSCNFVNWSLESAKKFGYKDIRGLRAAFYRRAKLLYDFGVESSPVAIAQAALLLSHWTPPVRADMMPNTVWLSMAIQNAKNIQAPYAATLPPPSGGSSSSSAEAKRNNTLKRLWWCCVLRDRVLPLGLRRGIQITRAHFDFERHRPLGLMDLDDEIHRSAVYGADAKRELIHILSQVLDLCVILTDVLLLVFPLDSACGDLQQQQALPPLKEVEIRNNKKALVHWYTSAVAAGEGGSEINWNRHESVIVYTHWMYTYYHSARMALYHHELQHYLALMADNTFIETQRILETRDAIQNAFSNITESLRGLNQRQLTRWLPISATAYIAFPLALHVLNSRLSAAIVRSSPTNGTLIEVMKAMHLQYDGVDWVARLIGFLVDLVQDDLAVHNNNNNNNNSNSSNSNKNSNNNDNNSNNNNNNNNGGGTVTTTSTTTTTVTDWAELLAVRPRTYLRLSLAMDLSMSSGRFPDKTDFLARLDDTMRGSAPRLHGANHLHHSHHNHMHHRSARPMRSLPGPTSRPHGVFDAYATPWRTPRGTAPPSRGGGGGGGGGSDFGGTRAVAVPQQEEQEQQQQQQQPSGGSGGDATATTTATASTTALHRDGGNDGYVVPGEEDAMCDAAYLDALGEGFAADADLDRFTSLPDDLDHFFDPTLGDLTSSEESPASKSLDADIDNALMAAASHEMIQL